MAVFLVLVSAKQVLTQWGGNLMKHPDCTISTENRSVLS